MRFDDTFNEAPLIAILRGITPHEIGDTADALHRAGVRIIEVPLNSPDPFASIRLLAQQFTGRLMFGAGTVLTAEQVDKVFAASGQLIVAPNTKSEVIRRSFDHGMIPMPGFASATEAFTAYDAGARYLKLFPASTQGPAFLKQLLAVLPSDAAVIPVGGIAASDIASWWDVGARGFGIGSEIYRPRQSPQTTYDRALAIVSAVQKTRRQ